MSKIIFAWALRDKKCLLIKLVRFLELRNNSDVCRVLKSKKLILWYIKRFIGIFFPSTKFFINWSLMFLSINSSAPINFVICKKYNDWTMKWKFQTLKSAAFIAPQLVLTLPFMKRGQEKEAKYPKEKYQGFSYHECSTTKFKICCTRRTGWLFIAVAH